MVWSILYSFILGGNSRTTLPPTTTTGQFTQIFLFKMFLFACYCSRLTKKGVCFVLTALICLLEHLRGYLGVNLMCKFFYTFGFMRLL